MAMSDGRSVVIAGDFSFPGGGAPTARVRNLALGFRDLGWSVAILPMSGDVVGDPISIADRVTCDRVPASRAKWRHPPEPASGRALVRRCAWFLRTYGQSRQVVRRFAKGPLGKQGDVLVSYGRSFLRLAPMLRAAKAKGMRVVLDVVEGVERFTGFGGPVNPIYWDWRVGMRRLPRMADAVTAISTGLQRRCERVGARRVHLLPCIEDWSAARPPVRRSPADQRFTVFYLGSLVAKEDPGVLCNAVARLSATRSPVGIVVAGRYGSHPEGRNWATRIAAADAGGQIVRLAGELTPEQLAREMDSADGFALLRADSVTERLSFPTRLAEFLRVGRPVLVSDVGDVSRYLQDGVHALLIPPGVGCALPQRICELAESPDCGFALGLAGQLRGGESFDRTRNVGAIAAWLSEA